MTDEELPLYFIGIGGDLDRRDMLKIRNAVEDGLEQTDIDSPIVLINKEIEAITKGDLRELIDE